MKKLNKFISLFAAAALLVLLPGTNKLTAAAEEPTTYYIRSIDDEWRFQAGSAWDDTVAHRELYYMNEQIKDGDVVIVDGSVANDPITVNVRLSNLTVKSSDALVFTAKGYDQCFILDNNIAAINGDVKNAYVYGISRCNFNSNVTNLEVIGSGSDLNNLNATVAVVGTVSHLKATDSGDNGVYFEYYDFPAGKFHMENGTLKTSEKDYSKTPSAQTTAPAKPANPQQPAHTEQPSAGTPSSDYDDVPKTGESNIILWLTAAAAVCLMGRFALKKAR